MPAFKMETRNPQQPELFGLSCERAAAPRGITAIGSLRVRHDHVVLVIMLCLIGVSIVFALGVERGKSLVSSAIDLFPQRLANPEPRGQSATPATISSSPQDQDVRHHDPNKAAQGHPTPTQRPVQSPSNTPKTLAGELGFAIQVVSYSQPKLAQQELTRLKQHGERAFLVLRKDRVAIVVGPFTTKEHAKMKLASLRQHYQDCFLRNL